MTPAQPELRHCHTRTNYYINHYTSAPAAFGITRHNDISSLTPLQSPIFYTNYKLDTSTRNKKQQNHALHNTETPQNLRDTVSMTNQNQVIFLKINK